MSQTKSSLLRQESILKKKIDEEDKILAAFREEKRDSADYLSWKSNEKQRLEEERLALIEKRKLEDRDAADNVEAALKAKVEEKQRIVENVKKEKELRRNHVSKQKEEEDLKRKSITQSVRANREAVKSARIEVTKSKREEALEVDRVSEELRKQHEEDSKSEKTRSEDMIRQIRALELLPRSKTKTFDIYESGDSYMNSMSLGELRARIQLMKQEQQIYLEEKRQEILLDKKKKRDSLEKKQEYIKSVQNQRNEEGEKKRLEMRQLEQERAIQAKKDSDESILKLYNKLETKKKDKDESQEKWRKQIQSNKMKYETIAGDALALEFKRFEEQELAEERAIIKRQEDARKSVYTHLEIKEKQERIRKEKTDKKMMNGPINGSETRSSPTI